MKSDRDLKPRKSPQQERSRETVDAVFQAMLDVLERQDTSDPSMQAIADRAGVSVGSVYQYFPSKGALVNALIGFHLRRQMAALARSLEEARGLSAERAAEFLVDGLLSDKQTHSRIERAMLRYFLRAGDLGTLLQHDDDMMDQVQRFLESLGPAVRPTDLGLAAFIVSNALRSAILLSLAQKPEQLLDPRFRAELIHLVVSYLRPASAPGHHPSSE